MAILQSPMLEFKPINLERHQDLCMQFRADAFACSFGSTLRFYGEDGKGAERYLRWLRQRISEIQNSCIHLWKGEQVVGQMEMGRWNQDLTVGYVNLFYLIPEFRGQGWGQQLDQYATHFFKQLGCPSARLSVSPTNLAARKFYLKQGWIDLGQREDTPEVHYFEKTYETD